MPPSSVPPPPETALHEYLATKVVQIAPKNHDEAIAVQKKLFSAGIYWAGGGKQVGALYECVQNRMVVCNGFFQYIHPSRSDLKNLRYDVKMSGAEFLAFRPQPAVKLSDTEKLLLQEIRLLGQRLTSVEEQLRVLREEVAPVDLGKIKAADRNLPKP